MKAGEDTSYIPGKVALFGSGETSTSGGKVFERLLRDMAPGARVALLETPAGFELNSAQVIGRVEDFLERRLQNFGPQTFIVPARKRGTKCSPENPEIANTLLEADLIFMGPGSPTYAIRQLRDSLTWHTLVARHRLGATLAFASAAVIAIGSQALPVYEIYKAGEDLHWKPGLDLFGPFGLSLVFVPHWNNTDGGEELDTSRCFMGKARFAELWAMLPKGQVIIGIDENTALILDLDAGEAEVMGLGEVTLLQTTGGGEQPGKRRYASGERFPLEECCPLSKPYPEAGLPPQVWEQAVKVARSAHEPVHPPEGVRDLVAKRERLRQKKDWADADRMRKEILELGWEVKDSPEGPSLHHRDKPEGET